MKNLQKLEREKTHLLEKFKEKIFIKRVTAAVRELFKNKKYEFHSVSITRNEFILLFKNKALLGGSIYEFILPLEYYSKKYNDILEKVSENTPSILYKKKFSRENKYLLKAKQREYESLFILEMGKRVCLQENKTKAEELLKEIQELQRRKDF